MIMIDGTARYAAEVAKDMDANTLERFILDEVLRGERGKGISMDEPLIASGVIDSLGILRLIGFLEQEAGLTIGDGEVSPENFATIRTILAFVDRKKPG
jgi:acyl carrier protein